ncbi:hypothetical protein R3I94_003910 [Phoxinus phoxinus]
MESKTFFPSRDIYNKLRLPTQSCSEDEGKDQKQGGSRCMVLMTVCLGLICVLLLVFITLYITTTAERDLFKSYKNTVEEFIQTINSVQDKNTDLMTEKDQLKNNFNSLSQKKLELETEIRKLSTKENDRVFISSEEKSWSDCRQFCRDRGSDLVIINTEEQQRLVTSLVKNVWFGAWIGLSDSETEGIMTWVDNSALNQGFWDRGEPNNFGGDEDCIELDPGRDPVNNWNDAPCIMGKKCICEK